MKVAYLKSEVIFVLRAHVEAAIICETTKVAVTILPQKHLKFHSIIYLFFIALFDVGLYGHCTLVYFLHIGMLYSPQCVRCKPPT